jgi:phenylpropionate dioxygenase-like ring-hydroxylating dioxygenase large terminal subunit
MSRFPFARYPNGWFQVAYSHELEKGAVMPIKYFGRELVLFRGEDGKAAVLDAYCPHLGAHLGHGGSVEGNCVKCPFHAWSFDASGDCKKIPYAQKIPPKAKVAAWHVKEINGLIMVWHHGDGVAPTWEVPLVSEVGSPEWTPYELRRWKIKTHNQEMAENAVDLAHFHYVHGTVELPTIELTETNEHVMHVISSTKMRTPMGKVKGSVEVHAYGFGFTTTRFQGIVETLLVSSATTIDEDYVDVRFSFMVKRLPDKDATTTVYKAFITEIERQLGQDIPIWENKVYITPPLLVDGDGPIGVYRKWAKQFYSDGPNRLPMATVTASA